ncbi:FmdB family zinc ribbon protein [Caballeronia zhejiangensis]|uniref:FmdB family zinc ribbon protein n=1 Tax=Caballeronia zhejiangensis TaxID=871203 RepID=UPI003CC7E2C9
MPIYEYRCARCGVFSSLRRLADRAAPEACPSCGQPSTRLISFPAFIGTSERQRRYDDAAQSVSPRISYGLEGESDRWHAFGCSCCRPSQLTPALITDADCATRTTNRDPPGSDQ